MMVAVCSPSLDRLYYSIMMIVQLTCVWYLAEIPVTEPARGLGHQFLLAESQVDLCRLPADEPAVSGIGCMLV